MKNVSTNEVLTKYNMKYLKNISTFGALSSEAINWIITQGKLACFESGEVIFEHSQKGDSFFVILEGEVAYYKWYEDKYAYISQYKVGQQIGFMSMVALHSRVGKAVADKETMVVEIDSSLFYQLHERMSLDFGLLMMNLAREMARTLCTVDNIVVKSKSLSL